LTKQQISVLLELPFKRRRGSERGEMRRVYTNIFPD
jgi:hypothetical protein